MFRFHLGPVLHSVLCPPPALFPIPLIRTIFATDDEIRNRHACIPARRRLGRTGFTIPFVLPSRLRAVSGRTYERRIDKNARGLFADERTQTPFFHLSRFSPDVPLRSLRLSLGSFPPFLNVTLLLSCPLLYI